MNEIEKKIITDEIKGLMNGITSITNSTMYNPSYNYSSSTQATSAYISELSDKTKTIKAYVAKIEEKVKLLEADELVDSTEDAESSNTEE